MRLGLGIDIVAIERIARSLERRPEFGRAYFSKHERSVCDRMSTPARGYARAFAIKEAFLKAVGIGVLEGVSLEEIEVRFGHVPTLTLGPAARHAMHRRGFSSAHVAWSCDAKRAWAVVLLVSS